MTEKKKIEKEEKEKHDAPIREALMKMAARGITIKAVEKKIQPRGKFSSQELDGVQLTVAEAKKLLAGAQVPPPEPG